MKAWFIALPLLCVATLAHAETMPPAPAVEEAAPPPPKMETQPRKKLQRHKAKRLPQGDIRYCLDLQTNEEIIKCAETRRKQ